MICTFSCLEVLVKKSDNTSLLYFDYHVEGINTQDGVDTNEKVEENHCCLEKTIVTTWYTYMTKPPSQSLDIYRMS